MCHVYVQQYVQYLHSLAPRLAAAGAVLRSQLQTVQVIFCIYKNVKPVFLFTEDPELIGIYVHEIKDTTRLPDAGYRWSCGFAI